MRRWSVAFGVLLGVLILAGPAVVPGVLAAPSGQPDLTPHRLRIPLTSGTREVTLWLEPGFDVGVAAHGVPNARMLAQSPTGELVLSQHVEGKVVKLSDVDGDGDADEVVPILTGLRMPHGVAFIGQTLFVAETDRVLRLDHLVGRVQRPDDRPAARRGHHQTRTLTVGPDGKLYVSIGSSCDACEESDPLRAAIWRLDPDGGELAPFARGLRNAVGLTWSPDGSRLWATENERNDLGEEIPAGRGRRRAARCRLRLARLLRRPRPGARPSARQSAAPPPSRPPSRCPPTARRSGWSSRPAPASRRRTRTASSWRSTARRCGTIRSATRWCGFPMRDGTPDRAPDVHARLACPRRLLGPAGRAVRRARRHALPDRRQGGRRLLDPAGHGIAGAAVNAAPVRRTTATVRFRAPGMFRGRL